MGIPTNAKIVVLGFVFIAFLSLAFLGMSPRVMGMQTDMNGQMGGCPFLSFAAICRMNPLEHIAAWQAMLAALPLKNIFMLMTLLFWASSRAFFSRYLWNRDSLRATPARGQLFGNDYLVHDKFQEAFSDGILNPKIF